jgi:hypothetical protein
VNAEHGRPRSETGLAPIAAAAQGQTWRDGVDRILAAWLLSGIDRTGLWETVMAGASPAPRVTAIPGVDRPRTPGCPPGTVGAPDEAARRQRGSRGEAGERSGAPGE